MTTRCTMCGRGDLCEPCKSGNPPSASPNDRQATPRFGANSRRDCACGNPLRNNAEFCRDCEKWARRRLADQVFYHDQLNTELTRQTAKQAPSEGGHSSDQPLPFSDRAAELIRRQVKWLSRWWIVVDAAVPAVHGPTCGSCDHPSCRTIDDTAAPVGNIAGVSVYLAIHLPAIRRHPDGARFITSLRTLTNAITRMIDSLENRTRIHVGPCPEMVPDADGQLEHCPGEVEAIVPADEAIPAVMRCRACRTEWLAAQWNRAGHRITVRAAQLAKQKQLAQAITGGTAA